MLKQFFSWVLTSSGDPEKYSLALKGVLVLGASYLLSVAPLACSVVATLCFDTSVVTPAINAVVQIASAILTLVGGLVTLIGLGRKLYHGRWSAPQQ